MPGARGFTRISDSRSHLSVSESIMKTDKSNVAKIATFRAQLPVSKRALYGTLVSAMKKRVAAINTVALYARVSTKDGRQDVENQLGQLREYCAKQGLEITGEYVDHESGRTSKRKHFQEMLHDAKARKFDLLLFWSLDRVSREGVLATLNHLNELTLAGCEWRSYNQPYFDTIGPFRDVVISIFAELARQESIIRSERASAAIARLRRQGKTDHLGRKRKLVGAKLETARQLYAQKELSLREIARKLHVGPMTVLRAVR